MVARSPGENVRSGQQHRRLEMVFCGPRGERDRKAKKKDHVTLPCVCGFYTRPRSPAQGVQQHKDEWNAHG